MRRFGRGAFAAVTVSVALVVAPLTGLAATAAPAAADDGSTASAAQLALQQAESTGAQVEVTGERTEYTTTYANPDGSTFTLDQSTVPVRVKQADGEWASPDATLAVRADGTVGPKAVVADVSFSDGGDGAGLVRIAREGRSLSLGWQLGDLPKPTLDGANALYADVLPGVDLRMTATGEGFQELLIVKTPEAAADPALAKVQFSLATDGLTVAPTGAGGLQAVDENGASVFTAPAAQMWDSQGDAAEAVQVTPKSASVHADSAEADTDADTEAAAATATTADDDPTSGPGAGAATAVLPVQVSADSLTLTPDATILGNTDSSAFPVYIDPSIGLDMTARTQLRSDGYTDFNFTNGSDGEGKGTGLCGTYDGVYCGPGYIERLYYQFRPDELVGKKVLDVTFRDTETWSYTCDSQWVDLERTTNVSAGTTWAKRPDNLGVLAGDYVSAGRGSLCDPSQPDAPIEFRTAKLTSTVQDFAAGKFDRLTLLVKARDETTTGAWKRFKNNAELSVTYVGLPDVPKSTGIVQGTGQVCSSTASDPDVVADPTPELTAVAEAKYGGRGGASLRVHFYVQERQSDGSWDLFTEPVRPSTFYADSGDPVPVTLPLSLTDGKVYRLRASTLSYTDDGKDYVESNTTVATTGWCYFTLDTMAPKPPQVTIGSPYTECTANDCVAAGGPGQAATFTFAPAAGDTGAGNVVGYEYKLATTSVWSSLLSGSTVDKALAPRLAGTQQLQVRAQDDVGTGRWSSPAVVRFNVAEGSTAVGRWHFADGTAGSTVTTAADSATEGSTRYPATLHEAGAGWSSLARRGDGDYSLWLNDTSDSARQTGYAATAVPVVNTEASFTVSAWAYLTDESDFRTVLSEQGSDGSGFLLYYSPSVNRWVFLWNWYDLDKNGVPTTRHFASVNADAAGVPLKTWSHVTGVYDHDAHTISLYVNGRLQGDPVSVPTTSDATVSNGALQFGRGSVTPGTYVNYLHGRVDEAAVWQRALTADEVATEDQLAEPDGSSDVELMASWNPDGASGSTLADSTTGYGRSLSLSGGASLDGTSLVLDGVSGAATTAGPLVDETASFTVSTEVALGSGALADMADGDSAQVLGQRSADGSAWGLWAHRTGEETTLDDDGNIVTVPVGYWEFGRLVDGTFTSVQSEPMIESGTAVRLTGTYDAPSGTIRLFLGANESHMGELAAYTAVPGSGDFAVGKGYVDAAWGHYLAGAVTDIRVWAGAMTDGTQIATATGG
ncbi:LamG domain protein jellyroll fold domain protein [Actinobacteria bacterium OK074]|nr:LamG domain protein jellyroll fold domain protein [Actinobacteria bacterium OK074]